MLLQTKRGRTYRAEEFTNCAQITKASINRIFALHPEFEKSTE